MDERETVSTGTQTDFDSPAAEPPRKASSAAEPSEKVTSKSNELLSFPLWHQRLQKEHDLVSSGKPKLSLWDWCDRLCTPCKWLESVDYNTKICVCCCKYGTYKWWGTGILLSAAFYVTLFHFIGSPVLPGRTYFMLIVMFGFSFVIGYLFLIVGLPSAVGQLLVGIAFGNIPLEMLTDFKEEETVTVISLSEKFMMVIMLIRAGLQLDFAKIKGHVRFILQFATSIFFAEYILTFICSHFLLGLPWQWSALLGSILSPVSLSTVISIAEKNIPHALADGILPILMIASSSIEIVLAFYGYSVCIGIIFAKGLYWESTWWATLIASTLQILGGLLFGIALGCLAGMFPDRRSVTAPYSRIVLIGVATVALVSTFHQYGMTGAGVLSSITMIVIASNIWEELGWHGNSNPVKYFYSVIYFFFQPIGVSMVGFTIRFSDMDVLEVGKLIAVIVIGLTGRELGYVCMSFDKHLKITTKEKIFLAICLVPKGATEVLLAAIFDEIVVDNYKYIVDTRYTLAELLLFTKTVFHTSVIAILLTSPLAMLLTTFLAPVYLKGQSEVPNGVPPASSMSPKN